MKDNKKFQKKVLQLINAVSKASVIDMALFTSLIALKYEDDVQFMKLANDFYDELEKNPHICALLCKTIE